MDVWQIVLYGFGAFLAFRALAGLMEHHRRHTLQQLTAKHAEEENRKRAEERAAKKLSEEQSKKNAA